jgi:hypothetical protein
VVDEGGNPMALVSVRVQPASTGDRRVPITSSFGSSSRTDDNGAFRLFGLRPGEYVLVAEVLRMTGVPSAVAAGVGVPAGLDSPYGTTYYPGTTAARDAARIRVASGDEYGPVRFTLSPVRLTIIRAFVVGADGLPASTVSVSIRPEGTSSLGASPTSRTTSSDGTVEFPRMPPGDYVASVSHYGTRGTQFAWAPFTVSDDTGVLTIRLQAGVSIAGQMVFDGQPPARLPSLYVRGVSARGGGGSTSPALVGSDLQYTLRDQFGPTFVRADAPDGWHLKSVLLGGIDITDRPTEFVPDGPAVTVVLTPRASTLAGVVTTPAGVPADAAVLLLSEDSAAWHAMATTTKRTTTTAGDGKYRFEGLRPGRYLVVGTTRDDGLLGSLTTSDFELLSRYATRVTIGEAETRTLDLKRVRLR